MAVTPSYLVIAAALRSQIASGELAPGALVPSTRALARQWNVALATAVHALRTLANEGLVQGVPRFGTVVAKARGRAGRMSKEPKEEPAGARAELSRGRIVATALKIADNEGINALSLRGVASKLDVPVMSLYGHVKSKEELVRALTDSALGEAELPDVAPAGWRQQLELAARAMWQAFRQHPWLARSMSLSRPEPIANAIAYAEWMLRALDDFGLDAPTRMRLHITLFGFVQGIGVNLETEADARGTTGLTEDDWMQTRLADFDEIARSGKFPAFAATLGELAEGFDLDFDQIFELGLSALLDGFARILRESARPKRRARMKRQSGLR
jgi:DNA-binding transcriptional regulator YhcF (GntR family)